MNKHYNLNKKEQLICKITSELDILNNKINSLNDLKSLEKFARKICEINIIENEKDEYHLSNKKIFIKNLISKLINKRLVELAVDKENIYVKQLFKTKLYCRKDYDLLISKHSEINRTIGNVPFCFLKNIAKEERKEVSSRILSTLSSFSTILNYKKSRTLVKYTNEKISLLEEILSKITKQQVRVRFISSGFFGNTFKIKIGNTYYVYKTFFPHKNLNPCNKRKDNFIYEHHGSTLEAINALYCTKNEPKKFVKFYCGRFSTITDYKSFILTDFQTKGSKNYQKEPLHYLEIRDSIYDNTINGKIVDFGGIVENLPDLKDKELKKQVRIIWKNITHNVNSENFIITTKINHSNINVLKEISKNKKYKKALKIIRREIKTLPKEFVNTLYNPQKLIPVNLVKKLNFDSINNIQDLVKEIQYFNGKILLNVPANPFCGYNGYLIIQFNGYRKKFFYDKDNIIYKIENIK